MEKFITTYQETHRSSKFENAVMETILVK